MSTEQKNEEERSPSDKLQDNQPVGSQVPGAENPDSPEIKKEQNPNSE